MSSPVLILGAAWLLVIGYGLFYVGYQNLAGKSVTFKDAFFPAGLLQGPTASNNPIQNSGGSSVTSSTVGAGQPTLPSGAGAMA